MKPRHHLQDHARDLRNNTTDAERLLWQQLRNRQLGGVKFRRQHPIEEYIVDFASFAPKLVIELDGGQHADNHTYDAYRDACLRQNGYMVIRFWNHEVFQNLDGVLEVIRQHCSFGRSPTPQPPPARGGGAIPGAVQ